MGTGRSSGHICQRMDGGQMGLVKGEAARAVRFTRSHCRLGRAGLRDGDKRSLGPGELLPLTARRLLLGNVSDRGPSLKGCLSPHRKCSSRTEWCLSLAKKCSSPSPGEPWAACEGTPRPAFSGCCCCGPGSAAAGPRGQVGGHGLCQAEGTTVSVRACAWGVRP